jgi:hypothetical protein
MQGVMLEMVRYVAPPAVRFVVTLQTQQMVFRVLLAWGLGVELAAMVELKWWCAFTQSLARELLLMTVNLECLEQMDCRV